MAQTSNLPLLDLIDGRDDVQPIVEVAYDRRDSNFQRFAKFHAANPHVYVLIVKVCRLLKSRGFAQFGIASVYEQLRWIYAVETVGSGYRINNTWRSFYSRLVMAQETDLEGFFETRQSPHDSTYYEREASA